MTIPETCEALRVGRMTVMRLVEARELRAVKTGSSRTSPVLVAADSVQALITKYGGAPITGDVLPKLWTLAEVAEATGFALRTLEHDCRADRVAHIHRGRDRLMTTEQVWQLIDAHTVEITEDPEVIAARAAAAQKRQQLARRLEREYAKKVATDASGAPARTMGVARQRLEQMAAETTDPDARRRYLRYAAKVAG